MRLAALLVATVTLLGTDVGSLAADDSLPPGQRPVVPSPGPVPVPLPVPIPAPNPVPAPSPGIRPVLPIPVAPPSPAGASVVPAPRPTPPVGSPPAGLPLALAAVSDYRISPGDEVSIEVVLPASVEAETGNLFKSPTKIVVANDGVVDLPKSPGVRLDGRTRVEIRTQVQANLKAAGVSNQAEVLVNVTKYAVRFISVFGAVNRTVEVSPFSRMTILQVFAHCGEGMGEGMKNADLRTVRIYSRGRMRTLDVRGLLVSGGMTPDAYLDADDVVIVDEKPPKPDPVVPSVYIGGFVREPGAYRLYDPGQPGQPITLLKAIFNARGFAEFAYQDEVVLRRVVNGEVTQQVINLERMLKGKKGPTIADDPVLQQGDIVYVRGSG